MEQQHPTAGNLKEELMQKLKEGIEKEERRLKKEAEKRKQLDELKQQSLMEQAEILLKDRKKNKKGPKTEAASCKVSQSVDDFVPVILNEEKECFQHGNNENDSSFYDDSLWVEDCDSSAFAFSTHKSWNDVGQFSENYCKSEKKYDKRENRGSRSQNNKRNSSKKFVRRGTKSESNSVWDKPDRHFPKSFDGIGDAPSPDVNVWEKRAAHKQSIEEMVPHTDREEEAMLHRAMELSRCQMAEDEKRRKEFEKAYNLQMRYLTENPEFALDSAKLDESDHSSEDDGVLPTTVYNKSLRCHENTQWQGARSKQLTCDDDDAVWGSIGTSPKKQAVSAFDHESSYANTFGKNRSQFIGDMHHHNSAKPRYNEPYTKYETTQTENSEKNVWQEMQHNFNELKTQQCPSGNDDDEMWGSVGQPQVNNVKSTIMNEIKCCNRDESEIWSNKEHVFDNCRNSQKSDFKASISERWINGSTGLDLHENHKKEQIEIDSWNRLFEQNSSAVGTKQESRDSQFMISSREGMCHVGPVEKQTHDDSGYKILHENKCDKEGDEQNVLKFQYSNLLKENEACGVQNLDLVSSLKGIQLKQQTQAEMNIQNLSVSPAEISSANSIFLKAESPLPYVSDSVLNVKEWLASSCQVNAVKRLSSQETSSDFVSDSVDNNGNSLHSEPLEPCVDRDSRLLYTSGEVHSTTGSCLSQSTSQAVGGDIGVILPPNTEENVNSGESKHNENQCTGPLPNFVQFPAQPFGLIQTPLLPSATLPMNSLALQQMLLCSNPFFVQQLQALQLYYASLGLPVAGSFSPLGSGFLTANPLIHHPTNTVMHQITIPLQADLQNELNIPEPTMTSFHNGNNLATQQFENVESVSCINAPVSPPRINSPIPAPHMLNSSISAASSATQNMQSYSVSNDLRVTSGHLPPGIDTLYSPFRPMPDGGNSNDFSIIQPPKPAAVPGRRLPKEDTGIIRQPKHKCDDLGPLK